MGMASHGITLPQLHRRFRQPAAFRSATPYTLLPIRIEHLDATRTVLTNMVGEHAVVPRERLAAIAGGTLSPDDPLYAPLVSRHLIVDGTDPTALDLLTVKYRTKHAHLANFTGLHLFVTTLRCDHGQAFAKLGVPRRWRRRRAYGFGSPAP